MPGRTPRSFLVLALCGPLVSACAASRPPGPPGDLPTGSDAHQEGMRGVVISSVEIIRHNVFEEGRPPAWLFDTFNGLHWTTQDLVIRREVLLGPGDRYDPELAQETERILRQLPFLADAHVYPVSQPDGTAKLRVETRDRFTLRAGASAGFFGGSRTGRISLGESNLFGLGKDLGFRYRESDEDRDVGVSYTDPQLLSSHHVFRISADDSDDGGNFTASVRQPFRTLEDEYSYGLDVIQDRRDVRFNDLGDIVQEVPQRRTGVGVFASRAMGERTSRVKVGARAGYQSTRYGQPFGPDPDRFRVPGDTRVLEIGPTLSWDYLPVFAEWHRLDAMGVVEDVPLGFVVGGFVGLHRREEKHQRVSNQLAVALEGRYARELWDGHLVTLSLNGSERWRAGDVRGYSASAQLHYYYQGLPGQTLAASIAYDLVGEEDGLERRLTLDESSGLRGYDARFFNGDRRLRINLEDRIFPEFELLSVQMGALLFFDAGLAWDHRDGIQASDLFRSVGAGLRFGSPELVRRDVVRLDVAFPLDDHPAEDFSVSVSVSVGQVFEVFGNSEGLDRDF